MRRVALVLIRGYQRGISPLLPSSCRFVPSCSDYGYQAIEKYGIIRGGAMTVWRIMRCNPFNKGGYDPVP
jgi:putative membrane protein insertion efficiency factor